jgi:Mg/Co/Ni transporter MgtE
LPDIHALIDDEKVGRLIVRLDPDNSVTFIASLPEGRRERALAVHDPVSRAAVREIINYLDGTVRRLKTTHFMALPPATTAQSAIALGELEFSSAWKAIVKQVSANICIAIAAGAMIALAAGLWKSNPHLGLVLAGALLLNLGLMAGFAGAVIPLLLKTLKLDPAPGPASSLPALPMPLAFFRSTVWRPCSVVI